MPSKGVIMVRWNVREIAEPQGFTAYSLALEAKLPHGAVYPMWKNRSKRADLTTIGKIAAVLKVEPGALLAWAQAGEGEQHAVDQGGAGA